MRIVIDMQGAQTESCFRGIGRYTMAFALAVARNRGEHEIILALSGLFPDTIEPIRAAFEGLLPQDNIRVWHAPGPVRECEPGNDRRREVAELLREAFLASLQPDVIHICSLFEGYVDDAVTSIGRFDTQTPVSVTNHDLIPLINPDHYLKLNSRYEQYYWRKIESLKHAVCYLAVSESSRQEVIAFLGVAQNQTVNTLEAIDSHFHPLSIEPATASQLKQKFSIRRPFVLYTGGADERKNLPRLIEAYAGLNRNLRTSHQLVFAGRMPEGDIAGLRQIGHCAGLTDDELLFTGYVSDEELVQLYNLCALYVFPSWHEGFGLPALEAMACGAPVIGANTTSLPEVIGLDEALFDPFDVVAISQKMAQALSDEAFRRRLRVHGLQQAKRFSWDETASRAIRAWESLPTAHVHQALTWHLMRSRFTEIYARLVESIASIAAECPTGRDALLHGVAASIERNERQIDGFLRPRTLSPVITWRIEGPFDSSYSLALVNREVARALAKLGHRVVLHSTEGPGDFPANPVFLAENPDLAEMHKRASVIAPDDSEVVSRNLYPPRVADMTARFNFLHAYGWEESGFPLEWVDHFNLSLQGMTVMSEHVRKVMIDHGVTVPVAVSSLGVDHWQRIVPDASFHLTACTFRFLHVSSCFPRKGADVMLRAYGKAFRVSDDVTLVIKTFPNPHNEIHRWLEELRADDPNFPDVVILEEDLSDAQLRALYEQCHALVAPSRAEGFGLPMAEAILSGLPVITTDWSGQRDFCTPETAWLIDYSFARAKTHFGLSASVWVEPDEAHLAALMREVFEATATERQKRVDAGRRLLMEKFQWAHAAVRMVDAARAWAKCPEPTAPRIGWVTTWNTRCGIATYSEHLINAMPEEVTVLAAHSATKTAEDRPNVRRCWAAGDHDDLGLLAATIGELRLDTLVIQFNYGFFDLETFASFLLQQCALGRTIVLVMHATVDPAHAPHKKLSILVPALRQCQRILVHSPHDMNRFKTYGLIENVTLFPHGIIDYMPPLARRNGSKIFTIASYGFFLPHKGLLELIEAIGLLRDHGVSVKLEMLNAEYPVPESTSTIKAARELIAFRKLSDRVSMTTDFLTDQESLAKIAESDLIVFPYQDTGESSSAAVRYGIASGRPVAVTPLPIFEDVEPAVFRLPGTSPTKIAEGINQIMNSTPEVLAEQEIQATAWRAEHRYSKLGKRMYELLMALRNEVGASELPRRGRASDVRGSLTRVCT